MVPAVTSQADGCGSSKSQVQAQVLFLSETKIDRSYPNLGGLICGSIRIVSAGGNQMTPVVAVFGSVSYFSLHRCYGASRNDP